MSLKPLAGNQSRFFQNAELDTHRVILERSGDSSWLRAVILTPKLAADAGVTLDTRLALFWDDQQRLLVLKVIPGPGRHTGSRKPRSSPAGVLRFDDLGLIPQGSDDAYFPADAGGQPNCYQRDCWPFIVAKPDGNEIYIRPPSSPPPEPDPEEEQVEFGADDRLPTEHTQLDSCGHTESSRQRPTATE